MIHPHICDNSYDTKLTPLGLHRGKPLADGASSCDVTFECLGDKRGLSWHLRRVKRSASDDPDSHDTEVVS
jgi:hypothetical protein